MNLSAGIYDISADAYHADPAPFPSLSSSLARTLITQSPLHAMLQHPRLNPNYRSEEDSRFDIGTAAHAMLLERDSSKIVWCDFDDWRKNAAKEMREEARLNGQLPILGKYQRALETMVMKAHECINNSELKGAFEHGKAEQTIIWQEGQTWCRARLDLACEGAIIDYKTTENAEPETFIRQIARMGYDVQAEWYTRGRDNVHRIQRPEGDERAVYSPFVFLAQEITPPYACSLVALSNAYREIGKAKVEAAIAMWERCMSRQEWPSYPSRIHYAEPTPWELARIQSDGGGDL